VSIGTAFRNIFSRRGRRPQEPAEPLRLKLPARRSDRSGDEGEPRFRMLASDRTEDNRLRPHVREAFMPSQPVMSRNMLAGRISPLRQLIQAVEDHRAHLVLYGERGIGKTSMLGVFAELARDADYLVIRENCGAETTFDELFRSVSAQIPLLYYGALAASEAQSRASGTIADLLPSASLGPNQLSRVWSGIVGTRVLIILDEFDRTDSPTFHRDIVELIKNLSDSAARIQIVVAGVAQTLRSLLGHSPSIRRNIIGMPLPPMGDAEVVQLIEIGERHAGIAFEPKAKARIVALVQGRPYLARLIAHHASLQAVSSGRQSVGLEDVDYALGVALVDMETRFSESTIDAARSWLKSKPELVVKLAHASLNHGGTFELNDLLAEGAPREILDSFIAEASRSMNLVAPLEEGEGRYSFVEDGLPAYLMLAANQMKFAA
jgi:Cdc6-like AAA superfamily ATPase